MQAPNKLKLFGDEFGTDFGADFDDDSETISALNSAPNRCQSRRRWPSSSVEIMTWMLSTWGVKYSELTLFCREKKFFGGHGIVGAQVPIGVGLAFSHKYKGEPNVCLTYLGDGAVNQGQVYESFNMAALWCLPCLFIIENNQYGMGTAVTRAAAGRALADRGLAYGIPGKQVDGMDVLAVRSAALEALAHCREGHGPYILEMKTYRYRGHSMSDPAKYRTREEVEAMRKQYDPIDQMRDLLKSQDINDEQLKSIDSDVKVTVTKATEFAQASPKPDVAELFTDILLPVDDDYLLLDYFYYL